MNEKHERDDQHRLAELEAVAGQVEHAQATLAQALARLQALRGQKASVPVLSAKELARVEKVGEVAYRHVAHLQQHGKITLGESLQIRRELYGDRVQGTARLFGRPERNPLFHRADPDAKQSYAEEIVVTEDARRIAALWIQVHGDHQAA